MTEDPDNSVSAWSDRFDGPNPVDTLGPARRPDFLCVGTEKAGTTWLWHCAMAHPGIGVPAVKELRFFNADRHIDHVHFRALKQFLENPRASPLRPQFLERVATEMRLFYGGLPAYFRVFGQLDQPIVGEITPQYCLQGPERIREMHAAAPGARIIYMLRDPVDRILSGARMGLTRRGIDLTDAEMAAEAAHPLQRRLSNSAAHLDRFETVFGTEAVRTFFFDDIASRPADLFADICGFIGADAPDIPDTVLSEKVNRGVDYRPSQALRASLYSSLAPVYAALERRFPERVAAWRARHETRP